MIFDLYYRAKANIYILQITIKIIKNKTILILSLKSYKHYSRDKI